MCHRTTLAKGRGSAVWASVTVPSIFTVGEAVGAFAFSFSEVGNAALYDGVGNISEVTLMTRVAAFATHVLVCDPMPVLLPIGVISYLVYKFTIVLLYLSNS